MFTERTSVGLEVHARSVVAAAFDGVTGEVFRARLVPDSAEALNTRADLLTEKQTARVEGLFVADEHVEVEATWGIYQRMTAALPPPRPRHRPCADGEAHRLSQRRRSHRPERDHHPRAHPEDANR